MGIFQKPNNAPLFMVCSQDVLTAVKLTWWQARVVIGLVIDRRGVREFAAQFGISPSTVSETYARARAIHPSLPAMRRGRSPRVTPFSQLVRNGSPDSAAFDVDRI